MAAVIFAGSAVKTLKDQLQLFNTASILTGTADPTSSAQNAPQGSLYLRTGASGGRLYVKLDSGSTTNWRPLQQGNAADIPETSFSAANNQSAAANVTGLAFASSTVRSFEALVSVFVNATTPLYEVFTLTGINKGSSWQMSATSVGDNSQFAFTITSAGQVQYTSGNYTGFTLATVKFVAFTTSV